MTTKRVGLVIMTQPDYDLPWVAALAAHCGKVFLVVNSPSLDRDLEDRIADLLDGQCALEIIQADLSQTEGQGRLSDFIRQRSPIHCVVNLYGYSLVPEARPGTSVVSVKNTCFIEASMDGVLARVRRDIDATLLLSQVALAGMKPLEEGLLLQVFVGHPEEGSLSPFSEATAQFVEQFSEGLKRQLAPLYPQIAIQHARHSIVLTADGTAEALHTAKSLLANASSSRNAR